MDPELKNLLEENIKLSKENNEMLLKLYKAQQLAHTLRYVYWFVIIGVSVGAFYFVKPMLGNLMGIYGVSNISDVTNSLKSSQTDMQELLKSLNQ